MANRVIHKFNAWEVKHEAIMETPLGKVLLVDVQFRADKLPTLWIERFLGPDGEPNNEDKQTFVVYGTGDATINHGEEHVGSCITEGGFLVWHVYRRP